jgi:hypothetical protein
MRCYMNEHLQSTEQASSAASKQYSKHTTGFSMRRIILRIIAMLYYVVLCYAMRFIIVFGVLWLA